MSGAAAQIHAQVEHAERAIRPHIRETALERSLALSQQSGSAVFLKCEHQQHTGSFKFRGALNKILSLSNTEKAKGVIAASTGNHGLGVALAASITGVEATIYVPKHASKMKLDSIKALGTTIVAQSEDCLEAEITARAVAQETNRTFISPYNDVTVIAGQGTIGLELFRQNSALEAVFISVGGGGLISGIAGYLKQMNPKIRVIGCLPENAPAMLECVKAGKIINVPEKPTLSDATAGGIEPGAVTLQYCRTLVDEYVLVSETEIARAMQLTAEYERWMIEGSAGVALAAFLKTAERYRSQQVAIVLCGRNISIDTFMKAILS